MQVTPNPSPARASLQLLLFVDHRPSSKEQIRQLRSLLQTLGQTCPFELQIVDVVEQPYLAEHFRLIATPALVKIEPKPRHTLAGSNLVEQVQNLWPRWQASVEAQQAESPAEETSEDLTPHEDAPDPKDLASISYYTTLLNLSDSIFRLQREKEELVAQLQFKDQILAMLAHDLRNPLTAASIAMETLDMGLNVKAEGQSSRLTPALLKQLLTQGRAQLREIDRMITDLLQAARGNQGGLEVSPRPTDLVLLCQEVLNSLQARFDSKSQQIKPDIPSDLPPVYADVERVRQVLMNLLDNAIKYTPPQGTISLSVLHRTTQKVQISICDNGPGIPADKRELVFEDRFRLQRDVEQEGYGIGLALCQKIIRAHYGQIWVDSMPNQGSCFHFTLPVCRTNRFPEA
ncbi:MAG: histidine kinase [Synechococcales bacterium]|nr:histidine kinase [Synechococcales bacterium]